MTFLFHRVPRGRDPRAWSWRAWFRGFFEADAREARGLKLLKEWLSPQQLAQFNAEGHFEVIGCHSGKRYRILRGAAMNVQEIDAAGRPLLCWCFVPNGGHLVPGDVMLAQKIALETDELSALAVANKFPTTQNRSGLPMGG